MSFFFALDTSTVLLKTSKFGVLFHILHCQATIYLSANPGGGRGGGGSGGGMGRGRSGRDMGLVGKTIRIVMGPYKVWLYQYCTS